MLLLDGRLDDAEARAEQTYAEGAESTVVGCRGAHLLALSMLRREQGRLGELEEDLIRRLDLSGYRLFRCVLRSCASRRTESTRTRVLAA